jgi:hypothetical protein
MIDESGANKALHPIWDNLPHEINKETEVQAMSTNAAAPLPKYSMDYYYIWVR